MGLGTPAASVALLLLAHGHLSLALRRGEQPPQGSLSFGGRRILDWPDVVISSLGHSGSTALARSLWSLGLGHCMSNDAWGEPNEAHGERMPRIRALLAGSPRMDVASYSSHRGAWEDTVAWLRRIGRVEAACTGTSTPNYGPDFLWSFKEPHFVYLLPAMQQAYYNRSKFLIVARDPRDICTTTLKDGRGYQLENYGDLLAHKDDCYGWWSATWNMLLDSYEGNPNFAVVRIEDLVMPSPWESNSSRHTLRCVLRFIGMKEHPEQMAPALQELTEGAALQLGDVTEVVAAEAEDAAWTEETEDRPEKGKGPRRSKVPQDVQVLRDFHGHRLRYLKGKRTSAQIRKVEAEVAARTDIHGTMRRLGYNPYSLALDYPSSPSMCAN